MLICRTIAEKMRGNLSITYKDGEVFTEVKIPLFVSQEKKMLIRIVDDDEDLAESLKFLLEPEGWKVVSYLSAEDYLKSDAPSVEGCLLLDIRMPGLSGLELQENERARLGSSDHFLNRSRRCRRRGTSDEIRRLRFPSKTRQSRASHSGNFQRGFDTQGEARLRRKFGILVQEIPAAHRPRTERHDTGVSRPLESRNFRASEYKYQNSAYASTEFLQKLDVHSTSDLAPIAALYRSRKITL